MMGTEIFKIDASWTEKLTKTRVQFLLRPTVVIIIVGPNVAYHGRFLFPLLVSISVVCLSVLGWAGGVL